MASTLDYILGTNPDDKPRKSGAGAAPTPAADAQQPQQAAPQRLSMAQLYTAINGGPPKEISREEQEKQARRHKRNQIFAAIGDGISALSNLYFTTQYAPNMYTPTNTLSQQEQARYDKIKAANSAGDNYIKWWNGYQAAMQADRDYEQKAWKRRRTEEQDKRAQEKDEAQREQWRQQFQFNVGQKEKDNAYREREMEEKRRQFDAKLVQSRKQHDDNMSVRNLNISAGSGGGKARKIGFSDGDGNRVSIYEKQWEGSMPYVFQVVADEVLSEREKSPTMMSVKYGTTHKMEDFVKQNWYKSPTGRKIMLALSGYNPDTDDSYIDRQDDKEESGRKRSADEPHWGDTPQHADDEQEDNYAEW